MYVELAKFIIDGRLVVWERVDVLFGFAPVRGSAYTTRQNAFGLPVEFGFPDFLRIAEPFTAKTQLAVAIRQRVLVYRFSNWCELEQVCHLLNVSIGK